MVIFGILAFTEADRKYGDRRCDMQPTRSSAVREAGMLQLHGMHTNH